MVANPAVSCTHCGLPVPAGLIVAGAAQQFCCGGCAAAWRLLHDGGLAEFYRLRAAAGGEAGRPAGEDAGAAAFDSEAFRAVWARRLAGGDELIAWYLDGLHCPACVWLVEQLPRLLPGVRWARLDLGTAQLRVAYDPAHAAPGAQARLLARLGYRARPYRADAVAAALSAEHRALLLRVVVAAASAVAAMHLAATLTAGELTGDLDPGWRPLFAWGALLAALPGCAWAALPLHRGAITALRARRWSVDLAASLAIGLALIGSAALAWHGSQASYADAAAMFAALLLTARLAVVQARRRVARAAGGLTHLLPLTAQRRRDGRVEEVAIQALAPGDEVLVGTAAVVPGDGTVLEGDAAVDVAVLTGEPRPVAVVKGSTVVAGATCRSGHIVVRVEAVGPDTRLARILAAATPARRGDQGEGQVEALLRWFAPATLLIAAAAGTWWGLHHGWMRGAEVALAVVVAACPCAIGLAAPLVQALAAAAASRSGLLLRDPAVLARLATVSDVVCDKTGTLTEGCMRVHHHDIPTALQPAVLAMTARSAHPASVAIADKLRAEGVVPAELADWREEPGRGLIATLRSANAGTGGTEAQRLAGGRRFEAVTQDVSYLSSSSLCVSVPPVSSDALTSISIGGSRLTGVDAGPDGRTRIGVGQDGTLVARCDLDDPLREDAHAMVAAWRHAGAEVHLASGDHPAAVAARAAELAISRVHGGMEPEGKAALVRSLRQPGRAVAAVGDGVNDALMLAEADVAVGVSGGLEAALDRCHAFCTRPAEAGPRELWILAGQARRRIKRMLVVSALYNLAAVGGAAAGLFGPLVCAVIMPLSSLTVVILALRTPGISRHPPSPPG